MTNVARLAQAMEDTAHTPPERVKQEQAAAAQTILAGLETFLTSASAPLAEARQELDALEGIMERDVERVRITLEHLKVSSDAVASQAAGIRSMIKELRSNRAEVINAPVRA